MIRGFSILLHLIVLCTISGAQTAPSIDFTAGSMIPASLKQSLISGLDAYTTAQREERWEDVWTMMGKLELKGAAKSISEKEKPCILEQIKSSPLISFVPERSSFSTAILALPLSKKWWYLEGQGVFQTASRTVTRKTSVTAKRIGNSWFFYGPSRDDEWEKEHVDLETPSSDLAKFLSVISPPFTPISVEDVRVTVHPTHLSLRNLKFKVRNKSFKPIRSISYQVESNGGSIFVGSGQLIGPGKAEEFEVTYSAYGYFCQGEQQRRLMIEQVNYSDSTEWKVPVKYRIGK